MRLLIVTFILSATATFTLAQEAAQPAPDAKTKVAYEKTKAAYEENKARVMAELAASSGHGATKNSPLSCEEVNESVQTLADGNRIVRKSTGKMYRNSDGRVRRENSGGLGGMLGTTYSLGQGISITSPIEERLFSANTNLTTARVVDIQPGQAVTATTITDLTIAHRKVVEGKLKELGAIAPIPARGGLMGANTIGLQNSKYDVKTEELGTRDFEGVAAQGTRRITTIPADAIGNERPIEIVYERWFSKDLGLVVYSKNSDPRFGEQIYKLTNIIRAEPDPSLFAVPGKKLSGEPATVYRVVAGTPIVVNTTKPAKPQN